MNDISRSNVDLTGFPSIRDTDDRFRAIFDGVNDGIFIIDPMNGRFTEINHTGNVMFGYGGIELVGCTIETLSSGVHPEATLINLSPEHLEVIQRLRRAGIRMSLDDFGTGYSSLHYLRQFSVDRIKITQEFIAEIAASAEAASIVKLTLGLSRDFGSEVIAEGVETQEQLNKLRDMNCADVQGYYFSRPLSSEAMAHLLATGTAAPSGDRIRDADQVQYVEVSGSLQPSGDEDNRAAVPSAPISIC
jgi:hypothetical protein